MGVKQKKQRRRSKSAAMYIPIAVLLVLFLTIFGTSVFLNITEIEVAGASRYSEEEIIRAAGISLGDNMLLIDRINAMRRVTSSLPYIDTVNIKHLPPDTIRIEVKESVPFASVVFEGRTLIINSSGRVLEQTGAAPAGLIEIRGVTPVLPIAGNRLAVEAGAETRLAHMIDVLRSIERAIEREDIQNAVSYLDVTNIANITFEYLGRFRVALGGPDDVQFKLSRLTETISDLAEKTEISTARGRLDMSNPSAGYVWLPDR
jgi:cell division protein FtsQ